VRSKGTPARPHGLALSESKEDQAQPLRICLAELKRLVPQRFKLVPGSRVTIDLLVDLEGAGAGMHLGVIALCCRGASAEADHWARHASISLALSYHTVEYNLFIESQLASRS